MNSLEKTYLKDETYKMPIKIIRALLPMLEHGKLDDEEKDACTYNALRLINALIELLGDLPSEETE